MARLVVLVSMSLAVLGIGTERASGPTLGGQQRQVEVVVELASPPLAHAPKGRARLDAEQRAFRARLDARLPDAEIRWRYRLVANGFAVVLPTSQVPDLKRLPGVHDVYLGASYGPQLDKSPQQIGAPAVWGQGLETAGQGMKIGIIDSGIDQSHPFFDPTGYSMPTGFPKGQQRYTNAKVIVARSFPPAGAPSSPLPFDLSHGTHVAGIAAGNAGTRASGGRVVSGVAPSAYVGSYKVFNGPTANSPEILAAVEAAVADGMDVINFSGGQPEIEPRRDIIALGLDAAAAAGVVPVVAAGNDFNDLGAGSVSSPGTSEGAITVAAVETKGTPAASWHAYFSSVGPTAISLRLKPDLAAPGVDILSSVPGGGWSSSDGTSMAAPHVAGAAALLRQRHPDWTVAEIKSALVQTATDASLEEEEESPAGAPPAGPAFVGGGVVSLQSADRPLLFSEPSGLSFGLRGRGVTVDRSLRLRDAGGGAGTWEVSLEGVAAPAGTRIVVPTSIVVPGTLSCDIETSSTAKQGQISGYVTLRRGSDIRRVPFWGRVSVPALGRHHPIELSRVGQHPGTTSGRPRLVSRYRYPENPRGVGVPAVLAGPEVVYRVRLTRRVANFGVAITQRERGSSVEPRVIAGLDENRLTGYAGLPFAENPYLPTFFTPMPVAAALSPAPGVYSVVFDSPTAKGAGRFSFRYWVNDVTPPTLRLRTPSVRHDQNVTVAAIDAGSGVSPDHVFASIDGRVARATFTSGVVRISTAGLESGTHRLRLQVSDYQETKNTENVARILPNTRVLNATFRIRRS